MFDVRLLLNILKVKLRNNKLFFPLVYLYRRLKKLRNYFKAKKFLKDTHSCPVCNSKDLSLDHYTNIYFYIKCNDCQLIFVGNPPPIHWLENFYQQQFLNQRQQFHSEDDWNEWLNFKLHTFKSLDFSPNPPYPGAKILEIGSSEGILLDYFKSKGWKIKGIELNKELVKKSREKGLDVEYKRIEELEDEEKYDVILAFHVIEHLPNPVLAIEKISNLLKKGGILILETPVSRNWESIDHLYFFSEQSLFRFLSRRNWAVLSRYKYQDGRHKEFINLAYKLQKL